MSNEELALLAQAGDREQLPVLWEQVKRLCFMTANRYYEIAANNVAVSVEDLQQECWFAMLEALQRFKPELGSFSNILVLCARRHCRAALGLRGRVREEHYRRQSMDEPLVDGEEMTLADVLEDDTLPGMTDELELEELQRDVREAVARLPYGEDEIMRRHYLEGASITALADERGVTKGYIWQKKETALKRLRTDGRLREYRQMNFHRHKSAEAFRQSGSSVVEDLVLCMEDRREHAERVLATIMLQGSRERPL